MASDHARPAPVGELRGAFPCVGTDLAAARACEEAVFGRWFGNSPEELAAEYGPYEASTSFGAVFDVGGTALGAVRLVRPGPRRVKTLEDAAGPPWRVSEQAIDEVVGTGSSQGEAGTWDVASFGVDAVAAGSDRRVAAALLSVMFGAFAANDVTSFVAMMDSRARTALLGLGMRLLDVPGAEPAPYLGSPLTVPVHRRVSDLHDEHADRFPQIHPQVFHGRGVEGPEPRAMACTR